jgi:hypothetical protein
MIRKLKSGKRRGQVSVESNSPLPDDGSALPITPCDDDIDLNDEDTDTVDEDLPVATERHSHVGAAEPGIRESHQNAFWLL